MSTWISRAALVLLLAACVPVAGGGLGLAGKNAAPVLGGAIEVAGPRGYCIDRKASRETEDSAVMVLGRCAGSLTAEPALIAIVVGAQGSSEVLKTGASALTEFFASADGRAALARDGRAGSVTIHSVTVAEGALVLHLTDRSVGRYWRALIGARGRLVTISVSAPVGDDLAPEAGRALLDATIAAMRAANRGEGG
ncbi:hypothetical protein LHP98_15440 [Rhodobacter sp. Har01]|uniref:hypothetical protein n=1 Tax=Rhodobacter sp. Har01 TaxID=2883999 RepID=UPI001D081521|nr:hypothetical protein [Rhodobacter sp. Har01]MCB6179516.1 hypothetical protein [Rhodobacter sp. Har01]